MTLFYINAVTCKIDFSITGILFVMILIGTAIFITIRSYHSNETRPVSAIFTSYNNGNRPMSAFCYFLQISSVKRHDGRIDKGLICPDFAGGIGNQMFQFASSYGIAASKNMNMVILPNCRLLDIFQLKTYIISNYSSIDSAMCSGSKYRVIKEKQNAIFEKRMMEFDPGTNVRLIVYLQSFHYFERYNLELRNQFTFRTEIQIESLSVLFNILRPLDITCYKRTGTLTGVRKVDCYSNQDRTSSSKFTLIGMHVRRGDWLRHPHPKLGFQTATKEYLHRSVNWYKSRYERLIFIVATNGLNWTKTNMPPDTRAVYLEGHSASVDMATLTLCDHILSTVGTFGWWLGWLAGGDVTYYKWPAREGSEFRKTFDKNFTDHFLPQWTGL